MMNTQSAQRLSVGPGQLVHLVSGGQLEVTEGRVWLTRLGDLDDHLIEAGQRIRVDAAQDAIIESWRPTDSARVRWVPQRQPLAALVLAEVLRVAARGFAALA